MNKWQKTIAMVAVALICLSPASLAAFRGGGIHLPAGGGGFHPGGGGFHPGGGGFHPGDGGFLSGGHSFTPRPGGAGFDRHPASPILRPTGGFSPAGHGPARPDGGITPYKMPTPAKWHGGQHPVHPIGPTPNPVSPGPHPIGPFPNPVSPGPHPIGPPPGPHPGPWPGPHPGPWPGPHPGPWPGPPPHPMPMPIPGPPPPPIPYYPPPWGWDNDVWPLIIPLTAATIFTAGVLSNDDGYSGGSTVNVYNNGTTSTATPATTTAATARPAATPAASVPAAATGTYYSPGDPQWQQAVASVAGVAWERYEYEKRNPSAGANDPDWFKNLKKALDGANFNGQSGADLQRSQMAFITDYLQKDLQGIDWEGNNAYVVIQETQNDSHKWSLVPQAPASR